MFRFPIDDGLREDRPAIDDGIDDGPGGIDDGPGGVVPLISGFPSWSAGTSLTLTSSSDVTTTVALSLENAYEVSNAGYTMRARTNKSGWRSSASVPIAGFSQTQTVSLTLGDNEVPNYGQSESFVIYVDLIGPSTFTYTVGGGTSLTLTNNYDSSGPVHGAKSAPADLAFSFGATETGTQSKSVYFDVTDPESGISSASMLLSTSSYGASVSITTSIAITNGRRYIGSMSINGSNVSGGTNASVGVRLMAVNGAGKKTYSSYVYASVTKASDNTGPTITTSAVSPITLTAHNPDNLNSATYRAINFSVSDSSGILGTPTITGKNTTSENVKYYGLSNLGSGNYRQTIYVTANRCAIGGSTSFSYTISATDNAGNTSTKDVSVSMTRTDNLAPTFSVVTSPSDLTFNTSGGSNQNTYRDIRIAVTDAHTSVDKNSVSVHKVSGNGSTPEYYQGWSGNEFAFRVYCNSNNYGIGATATRERYYIKCSDIHGQQGTSMTVEFAVSHVDNTSPTISVQHVDSKTFYTENNKSNPTGQTATGYIYWSAADNVAVDSVSATKTGSNSYISSVGSTTSTSSYGAQYRTSYVLISNFSVGSSYTTRSLVRLTATDSAGRSTNKDVSISGRLIDNTKPYFNNIPGQEDKTWLTSDGANQSYTFAKTVDVADQHGSIASHSVTKVAGTFSSSGITSSLSGGKLTFAFTPSSNDQTANNSYVNQTVRVTITDNHNNSQSFDYTARTRFRDNTTPNVLPQSGSTNEENCNFITSNRQNVSRTVYFTISDAFSAIDTANISATTPQIYYMGVTQPVQHSGNVWKFTTTIPVSGKALVATRTFWGYSDVNVPDVYGNVGTMRINFYGTNIDDVAPSIDQISCPAFNFTTLAGQSTIANTLTFRVRDSHSSLNTPTVTGKNGASAGNVTAGSNGYYTCPITVSRPTYGAGSNAQVVINASDAYGNDAPTKTFSLSVSYTDNNGPQIGTPSGNSTCNFSVTSPDGTIDKAISVSVTDEIALSAISVLPLNGAKGEVRDLTGISGTSSTATFTIRHKRSEYAAESTQTESYRITCDDAAGNTRTKDFSITVVYDDDSDPSITNAATTASVDFTESNTQGEKTVTYTFTAQDTGSGVASVSAVSDLDITQPVKGSGSNYSMQITVDRGAFPHDDQYHDVGSLTISVTDHGGNTKTHGCTVRAKLTDNVGPIIDAATPANVNLTTTGSQVVRTFALGVSDSGAINASTLQKEKLSGNGTMTASFSSGKINVSITHSPGLYTADNVYVTESYRFRIRDDNGNYSSWRTISYSARCRDTSPPTISSLVVPSFSFNENGVSELTRSGIIRLTDAHMGIDVGSFSASLSPADRGVNVGSMSITPGVGADEYVYSLTVNKTGQAADGSTQNLQLTMNIDDKASNSASTTVNVPVVVNDNVDPVITVLGLPSATALSSQNRIKSYTVTYRVTDTVDGNPPASRVGLTVHSIDNLGLSVTNIAPTQKSGSTYTNAVTVNAGGILHGGSGKIKFKITAEDAAGNDAELITNDSVITVSDDVDPTCSVTTGASNISLNNTSNTSQSVSAVFSVNDDLTPAGALTIDSHGATKTHNGSTVTLTKTFTYASGVSGAQELRCTVSDAAGNSKSAASSFTVNRQTIDTVAPSITNPVAITNGGSNKVKLNANTQSYTFVISSTITDSGTGVDSSSVKISSNNGSITGRVLHDTFDPASGLATFRITWSLNDSRWSSLWSNSAGSTVFSETFTVHASDKEASPNTNSSSKSIAINLVREDVTAPSLSISNIKTNGANISGSNPLLYSDANRTSDHELVINMVASDAETNLDQETWQLVLTPVPATGNSITYAAANGPYEFGSPGSSGLDVANPSGNNYQIAFRLQQPSTHSILGDIATGGIPFGNSTMRATISVSDNNNNYISKFADFVIKRVDEAQPVVGNLQARSGSLTAVTVHHGATSATHKVKVAASDAGSGLKSVSMNNSYVADSPASGLESGTRFYYFKRTYTFAEVWQDRHQSSITVSGLKATATDFQNNSRSSNSVNVVITANDTEDPSIVAKSLGSNILDIFTSGTTSATQSFSVTIEDDDTRQSAVSVVVNEQEGSGSVTLLNNSGAAERRVFSGFYTYEGADFTVGSHTRNWNIVVTDAAGNSTTSNFPAFTVNRIDNTVPQISSVTIFNSNGQSVSSATLDTSTNANFSGYIDLVLSDAHSSVDVAGFTCTSTAPVIIDPEPQVLSATKGRFNIALGANAFASALGYGTKTIYFNVSGEDVYGNSATTAKAMTVVINDSTPPRIENMAVANISLNHDVDGVNDPADKAFILLAKVTDQGSGLASVSASVSFNTGLVSRNNAAMTYIGSVGDVREWRYTVSASDLTVNAAPTDYTFKITAVPNHGNNTVDTKVATAQLVDNRGPRLTMSPVERLSGAALANNELVDVLTSVGEVTLVYEVTAVEKSDPISLVKITSSAGDLSFTSLTPDSNKSVKAKVVYTAADVLALTGGNYNQDITHSVSMVVADSHGNESSALSQSYRLRVNDNQDPTITNFVADKTDIVLKTSAKTQLVTFSATLDDNVGIVYRDLAGPGSFTYLGRNGNVHSWTKLFDYDDYANYGTQPVETFTLTVRDANNGEKIATETISVSKVDDEAPVITSFVASTSNVSLLTSVPNQKVTFTAVMSDNVAITSISLPTATYLGKINNTHTWEKTYRYADYSFGSSSDKLTLTISDAAGLDDTADVTINITKSDNQDPQIDSFSASSNSVELLSSAKTQVVTFNATISDNRGIDTVTLTGPGTIVEVVNTGNNRQWTKTYNYDDYSYGVNNSETFTLTITDEAGNDDTASVSVVPTKRDDEAPVISNLSVNNSTVTLRSSAKVQTLYYTATITDNVLVTEVSTPGGEAATQSGNVFSWSKDFDYADYNYGSIQETHTLTARDAAGNTDQASINITVVKIDNQVPTSTSISVDKTNFDITQGESTTITITAGFRDTQTGMSSANGSAKVLLENGDELAADRIDSLTITTSDGGKNSQVVAVVNVSFDDLEYGLNPLKFKISAEDNSGNAIISDLVTVTGNKYDSIPPEIISYKMKINGVESSSVQFNETNNRSVVLSLEAEVKDNKPGTVVRVNGQTTSNITSIDGVANGAKHTWSYNLVNTTYPIEDTTNLSYQVTVVDADGLTATSQSLPLTITRIDDIAPVITINSVKAVLLELGSDHELNDIIGGNNEFTIKSDPAQARHSVKLKIDATIQENNTLAAGFPTIAPVNGWSVDKSGNNYLFTKIVRGSDLALGANNLAFNITARDSAANANSDSKGVTFIANCLDNSKPFISSFTMSGVPDGVNNIPLIALNESTSGSSVTATFSLSATDNGQIASAEVQIRDAVNGISFDLAPNSSGSGSYSFSKVFSYGDFDLDNGVVSSLTITAKVVDSEGNIRMSNPINAELRQFDDVAPEISFDLTAAYTSTANDVTLNNGSVWTFKSSKNANGETTAYLKAVVSGSDARGIAAFSLSSGSAQGNAPLIAMVHQGAGVYLGSVNYSQLPEYGTAFTYQFTASVTDSQGQSTVETKNISFNKLDDISPTAVLSKVEGLENGDSLKRMSSAALNDNKVYVELDVNENTTLALSLAPTLSLNGTGTITLQEFTPSGSGASGKYRYQIALDKNDYQYTNIESGVTYDQGSKITQESLKLRLADAAGNFLVGQPVELLSFDVELEDVGTPDVGAITFSATNGIQAAGVNSSLFNLSVNNVSDSTKVTIAAVLTDDETKVNPNPATIGINGFDAVKSYNEATKTAFFVITINRAFYDSLSMYDQYEDKAFTVTFKDVAGNSNQADGTLSFRRTDSDAPVINSWLVNGQKSAIITHYDDDPQQSIEALFSADVSDERLTDMYYKSAKNGVEQAGRVPAQAGHWTNQTFVSIKPPKGAPEWDPSYSGDNYVFTLYAKDANGATVSDTVSLAVRYVDRSDPRINDFTFMNAARTTISDLQILTAGEPDATAIEREVFVRATITDFADNLDQLTISLTGANAFSNNVIKEKERLANVNANTIEYKLTLLTGTHITGNLQDVTVNLTVTDRATNSIVDNANLGVKIADNQAPVIYSMTSDFNGDETNFQNHVRATHQLADKTVEHEVIAYIYDETEVDLTSAVFQDQHGNAYAIRSAVSTGTYQASPSFKIVAYREVSYDDPELLLGPNDITVTATVSDINGNVSDPKSTTKSLYKEDRLAPTLLAMGLYPDDATTVKDNAWPAALIDVTSDANIDANGAAAAKGKSAFVIVNANIPSDTSDQVLLETSGASSEHSLIMCIKNHKFTVAAGNNSGSSQHNTSALLSFDMRASAPENPLASFMGSGSAVELALLVRLDEGAIILYVNGRLAAAAQADERTMLAWAGDAPEIALGRLVSNVNKRNAFGPVVTQAASAYNWSETVHKLEVYEWTSNNSAKVAYEAENAGDVYVTLTVNDDPYRGELRFTCLDNEPDVTARLSKNGGADSSKLIVNGVVREDVDFDYNSASGTAGSIDTYLATAKQGQKVGPAYDKNHDLESTRSMKINFQNLDVELPRVTGFTIVNESKGNEPVEENDIVQLSSDSDITLKITIEKEDNSGHVEDTDSFGLTVNGVDFTQHSTQIAGDKFSFRYTADWDDFFATGNNSTGAAAGNYYLNVVASVRDAAGNVSINTTRIVHIRTTDDSAPSISSVAFIEPAGMATSGAIASDDYTGVITLSSANPSVQVKVKVDYTDNNTRVGAGVSVNGYGKVYTGGPDPRSTWILESTSSNNNGGYSATISSTYNYATLSAKNADQYRFGLDGNVEQLTAELSDPHGNKTSFNFRVKIIMNDDVAPSMPQLQMSRSAVVLEPGDENEIVELIVTTQDDSNVVEGDVNLTVTTVGQDDISGLITDFSEVVDPNPQPANKKTFKALLTMDYTDITGPHSLDKTYTLGLTVKDSYQNTTTNNSAGQLVIQRVDNDPPTIQQVRRSINSTIYHLSTPANRATATYNEANVSMNAGFGTDLRFAINDVGGLNPATLFMKRSAYSLDDAVNPAVYEPDFSSSPEISLILKSDGKYEPSSQQLFTYGDFTEYSVDNTNKVYYQWWLITATDEAGNQTIIYMPWRIHKDDAERPALTQVNLSQSSVKNNVSVESTPFVAHSSAEQVVLEITSEHDKNVLSFEVKASDNDEIDNVYLLGHPNDPADLNKAMTGPDGNGVYRISREYAFNHADGYGARQIENVYVVAMDRTGNRNVVHDVPVYVNQVDVTAPSINLTITSQTAQDEIMYPGTGIVLIATAEVSDSNTGVLPSSVQQVGAANGWSARSVIVAGSKFQWTKTVNWDANELGSHTETFTVEALDNASNRSEANATFDYSITSNNNITLMSSSVRLDPDNANILVTSNPFSVDPGKVYEADYVFVMRDVNNLQSPVVGDVTLTGNGTLVSITKDAATSGDQTFKARVSFDTTNFTKGDGDANEISIALIVKDPYGQAKSVSLAQKWYVWNYETIDPATDFYYTYEANLTPLITKVRNNDGAITGYRMGVITGTFEHLARVAVNLPSGSRTVPLEPFVVEQREEDDPEVVKNSWSFTIESDVTANSQGVVEATVDVEDKSIDVSYIDDFSLAQVIYSNFDQVGVDADGNPVGQAYIPDVIANTPDNLSRNVNRDYLMNHPAISASINSRALNFIRSGPPDVAGVLLNEIPVGGSLDQLAHRNGRFGQEEIVETGQLFVLNGTVPYKVIVHDNNETPYEVVSEQQVHLIIKHKPGAATIHHQ